MTPFWTRRLAFATLLAVPLTFVLFSSSVAWAHALLLRSDPAQDALLQRAPSSVHLWFSEDLNGSASRIVVWDRYRHVMNQGNAALVPGQSRQMEVRLKPLPPGSYLVLWTSVSSQDGHVLRGSYLFSVKVRGPGPSLAGVSVGGPGQSFPDATGLGSLLAHWFELLAVAGWVGSIAFSSLILPPAGRRLSRAVLDGESARLRVMVRTSLLTLLLASSLGLLLQAYSLAGNDWHSALSTSTFSSIFAGQFGQLWIVRQLLVLLALAFAVASPRERAVPLEILPRVGTAPVGADSSPVHPGSPERGSLSLASPFPVLLGFLYLYVFAASGHAASSAVGTVQGSHIVSAAVFFDWLHFLGVALWLGGQGYLALVLIPALARARDWQSDARPFLDTLNRFSPVAYASIAAAGLSGVFSSVIHTPSWYAFFNSIYGRALLVKLGLIGLMMLTSAYTVYLLRPHIRRILDGPSADHALGSRLMDHLLGWLRVNPVLGAGVLLATSVMYSYPVPAGFSPAGPSAYIAHGGGLTASMVIKPDRSGPNTLTVVLRNSRGRPVQQAHVVVLTTMLDMVMGTGRADLNETAPGRFEGTTDLGMGGRWQLQLLVFQASGLTRMPVEVRVGT